LPPFALQAGSDFVITAAENDEHCIVSRISSHSTLRKETCPLQIEAVIELMGKMGANYADIIQFLEKASAGRNLSCRLVLDAIPQAPSVYALARHGVREKLETKPGEPEEEAETAELGLTPNLFSLPGRKAVKRN
jgi:hypothetical protein